MTELLAVRDLVKSFHGNRVVDDVSFDVPAGRIVALLGENGAGKSTLIKMLAGVYKRDSGRMTVEGRDVDSGGRSRISFIHQDLGLVDWMTVAENIALGVTFPQGLGRRSKSARGIQPLSWRAVHDQADRALALIGGGIDPQARAFDLTRTDKSLVAIARGLLTQPALLVLDEPTASLPTADVTRLFGVLRDLKQRGVGMIYVSHRLDEVYDIADSVVVMRNGKKVGDAPVAQVNPSQLVELIVGRRTRSVVPGVAGHEVRLELRDLRVGDVGPVSLSVRAGEVVGLVGLRGAGQAEVGRAVAGSAKVTQGSMYLDARKYAPRSPASAVDSGVGFATSNRETEGVAAGLSVRENIFLNPRVWGRRMLSMSTQKAEQVRARELVARFGIRPADPEAIADTLSGGNQQKVMLARWFGVGRRLVVLEEPTMGVDVGAKSEIYGLLHDAGAEGTSALVVSTDVEEVAAICHRALVFGRGRVIAELSGANLTVSALVSAASELPSESTEEHRTAS